MCCAYAWCETRIPSMWVGFIVTSTTVTQTDCLTSLHLNFYTNLQHTSHYTSKINYKMTEKSNFQVADVFNVKDKVALVTGGGSGIGLMIVQTLAVNGAKVYIVGRTGDKLERVAEQYGKDIPGQIIPIVGDVADKEGVE